MRHFSGKTLKGLLTVLTCVFAFFQTGNVLAENSQTFGDYTVHYNAFNSDVLQPSMAEAYGIVRSKNRGMLTVSIIKKEPGSRGKPVRAAVTASASNLTGQFRKFNIREIDEGSSVYYMSVFHVAHEEMLDFVLQILPEGDTQTHTVKFRQQFYTQ
ncbi:DUF4426 domain-containing protein [Kaarinaea lacus]